MSVHPGDTAYALLADGATIEIRPARPDDFAAVVVATDMHAHRRCPPIPSWPRRLRCWPAPSKTVWDR